MYYTFMVETQCSCKNPDEYGNCCDSAAKDARIAELEQNQQQLGSRVMALKTQLARAEAQAQETRREMRMCYCGKCEMPVISCTQWDCPGAERSYGVVSHDYDCEFCENRRKAYREKMKRKEKGSEK